MAITAEALQAELGTNMNTPRVLRSFGVLGATQQWYIAGGTVYPGHTRNISTTASDDAATQAAAVVAALKESGQR